MQVIFDKRFIKDIGKIKEPSQKQKIKQVIEQLEQAENLKAIDQLKKLKGHQNAYRNRIRTGNFRMGLFQLDQKTIELVRVLHRKDIYSKFP